MSGGTCIGTTQDTIRSQLTRHHKNLEANILNNLNETTCTVLDAKSSDSVGFVTKLQVKKTCVTGHEISSSEGLCRGVTNIALTRARIDHKNEIHI